MIGDPLVQGVEQGPQVSQAQLDTILGWIEKGKAQGAKVACGGKRWGKEGYFVEPTVFVDVTDEMDIAQEEIFGPVQVIMKFHTVEEVIERANASQYGLAGGVFTNNLDLALKISNQLRTGTVWVNCYDVLEASAPFGGYKQSGNGREGGMMGLEDYLETKTLHGMF